MPPRNDIVLGASLFYLAYDMQSQWQEFATCQWPVDRWLFGSYAFILVFRLAHLFGSAHTATGNGDFLLNLRHKETLPRVLLSLVWTVVLPLFAVWTGLGTYWLWESKRLSKQCLPVGMPLTFIMLWQILSYGWMIIHVVLACVAWVLERRLQRAEDNLRSVADADTVARWGQVSSLSGYTDLTNSNPLGGLTPEQIKVLPEALAIETDLGDDSECSICLNELCPDDRVRQLGNCKHTFHRSCIDLWLLRNPSCPLCKQNVLGNEGQQCQPCQPV